jgi:hypothetical protein
MGSSGGAKGAALRLFIYPFSLRVANKAGLS